MTTQRQWQAVPSNREVQSARVKRTIAAGGAYTKSKAISITVGGEYRIAFALSNGNPVYGQIYRNRAGTITAVGTERVLTGAPDAPTQYVEDIGGWEIGDSCELQVKSTGVQGSVYSLVLRAEYALVSPAIPYGKVLTDANV